MKTRMALVAVKGSYAGPWQRSLGHETGIIVENLGDGEVLHFESEVDRQLQLPITIDQDGHFPFHQCTRFRFTKVSNSGLVTKPTFVRIEIS